MIEFEKLQFVHPELLWLLLAPPLLALWRGLRGGPAALRLPHAGDTAAAHPAPRALPGGLRFFWFLLALVFLIVALARPRLGRGTTEIETSGIDILLTVDVSGSMEAMDFTLNGEPVNRLAVVKDVLGKFVTQRPNDRIGVVAFAGRPYLVSPLTLDHEFVAQRIRDMKIGQVEDGTAIGSALVSAASHLKDSTAKSRIAILLTDGVNNSGAATPETGAEAAKALGIKVYTIGAGTQGEAPMPVRDPFGRTRYQRVKVEIDEKVLQSVADLTGGKTFRATDTDSLERIYESINQLETTTRKMKKYENYEELYLWVLVPGLVMLLLDWLLRHTLWRRLP